MQIIDFKRKGNVVRFFLGKNGEQWGDDWNDCPYEYNAGQVYDEYVEGTKDLKFDFDNMVFEPCDGEYNSRWCKDDMKNRKVPCIIVVPEAIYGDSWSDKFSDWVGADRVKKYYFGDELGDPDGTVC